MSTKHTIPIIFLITLILISCSVDRSEQVLTIQPYDFSDQELLDSVKVSVENYYGFKVNILENQEPPASAFVNVKTPRYRADSILDILYEAKSDTIDYVLALTSKDISTTKYLPNGEPKTPLSKYQDWGIFGLGQRPGPCAIVSTFRLKSGNRAQLMERTRKVCMHEIGHNLGLKHCESHEKCVMRDAAESIRTVDNVDAMLCVSCRNEIN